jgi:hypothetical protein
MVEVVGDKVWGHDDKIVLPLIHGVLVIAGEFLSTTQYSALLILNLKWRELATSFSSSWMC